MAEGKFDASVPGDFSLPVYAECKVPKMTATEASNRGLIISALLAGFIAGLIWMVIAVLTDNSTTAVINGGFSFLVDTTIINAVIIKLVQKRVRS